ncbi:MAG: hypothetical protein HZA23_06540 [Nitrospirae bacterium]|nr:hypothetical protein [Nitrospirota bacterium]
MGCNREERHARLDFSPGSRVDCRSTQEGGADCHEPRITPARPYLAGKLSQITGSAIPFINLERPDTAPAERRQEKAPKR